MLRGERRFVSVFATVNVPRSSSPFVIPVHQIVPDCLGLLTTLAHRRRLVTLTSLAWTKTAPSATHDLSVRRTRSTALPPGSSTSTRNATRRSSSANCWRPRRSKRGRGDVNHGAGRRQGTEQGPGVGPRQGQGSTREISVEEPAQAGTAGLTRTTRSPEAG